VKAQISTDLAKSSVAFVTNDGVTLFQVVAPGSWKCDSAGGSGGVLMHLGAHLTTKKYGQSTGDPKTGSITADWTAGDQHADPAACAYFAAAAQDWSNNNPGQAPCVTSKFDLPTTVDHVNDTTVTYVVKETDQSLSTIGARTYQPPSSGRDATSNGITCTAPKALAQVCQGAVDSFVRSYGDPVRSSPPAANTTTVPSETSTTLAPILQGISVYPTFSAPNSAVLSLIGDSYSCCTITAAADPNNPNWIEFKIQNPNADSMYGFLELANGTWQMAPGSPDNWQTQCSIPQSVATDFGYPPAWCSS